MREGEEKGKRRQGKFQRDFARGSAECSRNNVSVRELSHDCQDHENRQHDHCDFPEVLHEAHIYSLLDDRVKPLI